jgi:regulator of RNase E activity RraA
MSLSPEALATLSHVSTATITTVLLKKGLRNIWMRGTKPLRPGQPRLVGPAFTLRFVPARQLDSVRQGGFNRWLGEIEDAAAIWTNPEIVQAPASA